MRAHLNQMAVGMLILVLGLGGLAARAVAQPAAGVAEEALDSITLATAGDGPSNVVFARLTVDPGRSVTLPPVSGMSVHFLVRGTWSVRLKAKPVESETAATPPPVPNAQAEVDGTPVALETKTELTEGSHLIVPPQTELELRNTGSEPTMSLATVVAEDIAVASGDGIAWRPLGDPVAVQQGSIVVSLTRIVVQPGAMTEPESTGRTEALDVVAGPLLLVINPGDLRITRATGGQETLRAGWVNPAATPDAYAAAEAEEEGGPGLVAPPPSTPIPGTGTSLNEGDAAVLAAGGSRVLRATGDTPAVILVMGVCVPAIGDATCVGGG